MSVSILYHQYIVISGFIFDIGFVTKVQECNIEIESFKTNQVMLSTQPWVKTADFVVCAFGECKMLAAYIYFLFYFVIGFVSS